MTNYTGHLIQSAWHVRLFLREWAGMQGNDGETIYTVQVTDDHPTTLRVSELNRLCQGVLSVWELHQSVWVTEPCSTPRKGCSRGDCRMEWNSKTFYHSEGVLSCDHCTDPEAGVLVAWPCPTLRALGLGAADDEDEKD